MPGKEKKMVRIQLAVFFKPEYMNLSLCSSPLMLHIPLACPYKTENKAVERQPD